MVTLLMLRSSAYRAGSQRLSPEGRRVPERRRGDVRGGGQRQGAQLFVVGLFVSVTVGSSSPFRRGRVLDADAGLGVEGFVRLRSLGGPAVRSAVGVVLRSWWLLVAAVEEAVVGGVGGAHDSRRCVLRYGEVVHDAWVPVVVQQLQQRWGGGGRGGGVNGDDMVSHTPSIDFLQHPFFGGMVPESEAWGV